MQTIGRTRRWGIIVLSVFVSSLFLPIIASLCWSSFVLGRLMKLNPVPTIDTSMGGRDGMELDYEVLQCSNDISTDDNLGILHITFESPSGF